MSVRFMIRRLLVFTVFAILAGTGAGAQTSPAPPVIRVATTTEDQSTPLLYAVSAGLFRRANLDVQVIKMNSGGAITAAVAGGAADIGKTNLMGFINAFAHNIPVTMVAPGGLFFADKPDGGLIVARSSGIQTAKDLEGKTISVPSLGNINSFATNAWMEQHGADPRSVHFVEVPSADNIGALAQGRIDAATLFNPTYQDALSSGNARVAANIFAAIAKRFYETCWFSTNSYADKNGEALGRFLRVLQQASLYADAHPENTLDLVASFSGIDRAALKNMQRATFDPVIDPAAVQPVIDAAVKYKALPSMLSAKDMISSAALKK